MRIGLFFGSFNPIHIGHLIIANYMATKTDLDKVWMVVTPQNPLKPKQTLAKDYDRLHLLRLAIGDNPLLEASDIEFTLPKPSFTVNTLTHLQDKHRQHQFVLIMGGDNLATLHKWKNYQAILEHYNIYVYQRPEYDINSDLLNHPNIFYFDNVPLMNLSASYIRDCIKSGHSIQYLVPEAVFKDIEQAGIYDFCKK
jgi:nicotinate-nucleotide adenylyltransferase